MHHYELLKSAIAPPSLDAIQSRLFSQWKSEQEGASLFRSEFSGKITSDGTRKIPRKSKPQPYTGFACVLRLLRTGEGTE